MWAFCLSPIYEHKRHDLENRVFSTPLVCCSIAPVCSVCAVWLSCAVFLVCAVLQYLCNICVIFVYRRHWVASSSKFIGECTVSMLKNWHYLIESCLNLNLNLEFWSGDSQSEYFYAQKTLNNKLWPSFRNKLIKSNFWGKKIGGPVHGVCIHITKLYTYGILTPKIPPKLLKLVLQY